MVLHKLYDFLKSYDWTAIMAIRRSRDPMIVIVDQVKASSGTRVDALRAEAGGKVGK